MYCFLIKYGIKFRHFNFSALFFSRLLIFAIFFQNAKIVKFSNNKVECAISIWWFCKAFMIFYVSLIWVNNILNSLKYTGISIGLLFLGQLLSLISCKLYGLKRQHMLYNTNSVIKLACKWNFWLSQSQ